MLCSSAVHLPQAIVAGPVDDQAGGGDGGGPASETSTWQEENARRRQSARAYAHADPYDRLCVMCQTLAPMHQLMARFLAISGQPWRNKQLARAASGQPQLWAIVEAAKLEDVSQCMGQLLSSMQEHIVATKQLFVPCSNRLLRFAMTSGGVCALHAYLRLPRQQFPYKVFLLLHDASDAQLNAVLDTPPCLRDELGTVLISKYGRRLSSPDEGLPLLRFLADIIGIDVANIEAAHSSTREFSSLRSRGWTASLETIASRFVLQQRQRQGVLGGRCGVDSERKASKPKREKPKRGGGGAWRVFARHFLQGRKLTAELASEMSEAYRGLSAEEFSRYEEAGEAAAIAHRRGVQVNARPARRGNGSAQAEAILAAGPGQVLPDGVIVAQDDIERQVAGFGELAEFHGDTLAEKYSSFKHQLSAEFKEKAKDDPLKPTAAEAAALAHFYEKQAQPFLPAQRWAADGHSELADSVAPVPVPTSSTATAYSWCPPVEKVVQAQRFAIP